VIGSIKAVEAKPREVASAKGIENQQILDGEWKGKSRREAYETRQIHSAFGLRKEG